jgi:hypothetical protein
MTKKDVKKAVKKALKALWFQCGDDLDDDQVESILDCIGHEIDKHMYRYGAPRGLNQLFDVKIRLGDTPLPEGSVILLDTGDTK